ncbi:MAG: hypothetical protein GAK35_02638 [Herbaspirillum frisingense]|uniref:Uncharacterized protein n=1 Tax=Herbaspirillum frisingense TaxID=92645 RepID=A0A7V8FVU4_9BURK|nr:MAG: hypothetical protein GAK35_02638 [Herbaspirillum frisingense]
MTGDRIGVGDIAFAAAVGTIALTSWAIALDFSKGDLAAWVQAIGSIGAIGAAIWVMSEQHRRQSQSQKEERDEQERRLLVSLRSEMLLSLAAFDQTTNLALRKAVPGDCFWSTYEFPERPFVIFESSAAHIGLIRNDEVRELIISSYILARGVLVLISMNNDLVKEVAALTRADNMRYIPPYLKDEYQPRLQHLAIQAIERYNALVANCEKIKVKLSHL